VKLTPEGVEALRPLFGAALEAVAPKLFAQRCGCCRNITGRPPTRAVALWTGSNDHTVPLCQSCLDFWFDGADDDAEESGTMEFEPRRVQWIDGSRTLVAADAAH